MADGDYYLQVSVDDAQLVQVVDSIQDLTDQRARILFCVKSFFHYSVEQFAAGNPAEEDRKCAVKIHPACMLKAGACGRLYGVR